MADRESESQSESDDRNVVLEVFGMKLSVKNRQLADVLTRDATDILRRDQRPSRTASPTPPSLAREVVAEAVPDVLLAPPSAQDEMDDSIRLDLKRRCDQVAERMGIQVTPARQWLLGDGLTVHVRVVPRVTSAAGAADMIRKLKAAVLSAGSGTQSILLVTAEAEDSHHIRAAIDALGSRCAFRVIDVDSLERLGALSRTVSDPLILFAPLISPAASVALPDLLTALEDLRRT